MKTHVATTIASISASLQLFSASEARLPKVSPDWTPPSKASLGITRESDNPKLSDAYHGYTNNAAALLREAAKVPSAFREVAFLPDDILARLKSVETFIAVLPPDRKEATLSKTGRSFYGDRVHVSRVIEKADATRDEIVEPPMSSKEVTAAAQKARDVMETGSMEEFTKAYSEFQRTKLTFMSQSVGKVVFLFGTVAAALFARSLRGRHSFVDTTLNAIAHAKEISYTGGRCDTAFLRYLESVVKESFHKNPFSQFVTCMQVIKLLKDHVYSSQPTKECELSMDTTTSCAAASLFLLSYASGFYYLTSNPISLVVGPGVGLVAFAAAGFYSWNVRRKIKRDQTIYS